MAESGLSSTSLEESDSKDTPASSPVSDETSILNKPDAVSPCSRKRKADHEEATECYSTPAKRRFESRMLTDEFELAEGKFLCWCSEWISISLENWRKHILNCQHSKAKGIFFIEDIFSIAMESSSKTDKEKDESFASTYPSETGREEGLALRNASKEDTITHYNDTAEINSNASVHRDLEDDLEHGTATPYPIRRKRPNRTEEERLQEFLDDPQVKEITPYQVLCRACNKWIKLRKNSRYCSVPWRCHKASCKWNATSREDVNVTSLAGLSKDMSSGEVKIMHSSSCHLNIKVPPANMHPSLQMNSAVQSRSCNSESSPRARRLHAEGRKAILEADPNAESVEPYRVLCRLCKKWVKLRPKSTFCSAPWQSHIRRCIAKSAKRNLNVTSASNLKEEESNSRSVIASSEGGPAASLPIIDDMTPKRRGRPRKNPALETTVKEGVDSDRSYESEEL